MADLDFSVNADTAGAIRSLRALESSISTVTTAFGAITAGLSLRAISDFSDSITSLRNRLILLTDSQDLAAKQLNGLAAIAIRSRTSLEGVGDLYYRIARSSKELGVSQADAARVTETVAKALYMSGVSAGEARGPLLQLGQALQSGRLQGDELRSVMEGLGPVAEILAKSLGVPVGQLKNLGAAGQISAEQVVKALLQAGDVVDQKFAKTIPTISSAFEELKTISAIAFNNFEQNTRTAQNLAEAIRGLGYVIYNISQNIDEFMDRWGGVIVTIGKVLVAFAAFTVVGKIVGAFIGTLSGLATLAVRVFAGFKNLGGIVAELGAVAKATGGGFVGLGSTIALVLTKINPLVKAVTGLAAGLLTLMGIDKVQEYFKDAGDATSETRKEIDKTRESYDEFLKSFSTEAGPAAPGFVDPKYVQQLDQQVIAYQRGNEELQRRLGFEQNLIGVNDRQKTIRESLFNLETTYLAEINKLTDEYRVKSQSKNKDDLAALPEIQKRMSTLTKSYQDATGAIREQTAANYDLRQAEQLRINLQEFGAKTVFDNEKKIRDLRDEMAKATMPELERKLYDIGRASDELARSEIERENSQRRRMGLAVLSAQEEEQFYTKSKARNSELENQTRQNYETSRTWATGWKQAFNDYVENATNAADQAKTIFQRLTKGLEDAFVNFAKTGRLSFKELLAGLAEDILRSNIRQLLGGVFGSGGGGGGGGGNFLGNLFAGFFANGGFIPGGKFGVVGERGPELVGGPANVTPLGGAAMVTYNINAVDAASFKSMIARDPAFIHAVATQGAKSIPRR